MNGIGRGGEEKKDREKASVMTRETVGMTLLLFGAVLLLIAVSGQYLFGDVGLAITAFFMGIAGYFCYPLFVLLIYGAFVLVSDKHPLPRRIVLRGTLLCAVVFAIVHIATAEKCFLDPETSYAYGYGGYLSGCWNAARESLKASTGGGVLFGLVLYPVRLLLSAAGAYVVLSLLTVLALWFFLLATPLRRFLLPSAAGKREKDRDKEKEGEDGGLTFDELPAPQPSPMPERGPAPNAAGAPAANAYAAAPEEPAYPSREPAPMPAGDYAPYGATPSYPQPVYSRPPASTPPAVQGRDILFRRNPAKDYESNLIYDSNSRFNSRPRGSSMLPGGNVPAQDYSGQYSEAAEAARPPMPRRVNGEEPPAPSGGYVYPPRDDFDANYLRKPSAAPSFPEEPAPPAAPSAPADDPAPVFRPYQAPSSPEGPQPSAARDFFSRGTAPEEEPRMSDATRDFFTRGISAPEEGETNGRFSRGIEKEEPEHSEPPARDVPFGRDREDGLGTPRFGEENDRPSSRFGEENDRPSSRFGEESDRPSSRFGEENDRPSSRFGEESERPSSRFGEEGERPPRDFRELFTPPAEPIEEKEEDDVTRVPFRSASGLLDDEETEEPEEEPEELPAPSPRLRDGLSERRTSPAPVRRETRPQPPAPHVYSPYVRPSEELLNVYDDAVVVSQEEKARNSDIILDTLRGFRVEAEVINVTSGSTVTRYDIDIPRNISVNNVLKRDTEIAMRLQARDGVNMYANNETGAVSIEVPNARRATVGLRSVMNSENYQSPDPDALWFAIGKDVEGRNVCGNIVKMKHMLVAGATGSGKSVCLNTMLVSLIAKYSPEDLRLILVDPKKVEFGIYEGLPHLMIREIVAEPQKAVMALKWAIKEMERRYTLFSEKSRGGIGVRDIKEYNRNREDGEEKMPFVVIVIDELADLMSVAKKDIEDAIQRLAAKARSAGIYLVLATQRPSVDVITGVIKSNLPTRIAFRVIQEVDSRVILDTTGAEKLLGNGDMLYFTEGMRASMRVQGAFISTEEVGRIVTAIKAKNEGYYDESVAEFINRTEDSSGDTDTDMDEKPDPQFIRALGVVVELGQASMSLIQRKCSVGYSHAGRMIEWMERMGYIAKFDGKSKARKVLITKERYEELYGGME